MQLWNKLFQSNFNDIPYGLAIDGFDNIYIGASTSNTATGGIYPDGSDALIIKCTSNGAEYWRKKFDGGSNDDISAITYNAKYDSIAFTGRSLGYLMLKPANPSSVQTFTYLASITANNGAPIWIEKFQGRDQSVRFKGIDADAYGRLYMAGSCAEGNCAGGPKINFKGGDILFAIYTGLGERIHIGQTGEESQSEIAYGITVDDIGNYYITGSTTGDFNGELSHDSSMISSDMFILRNLP